MQGFNKSQDVFCRELVTREEQGEIDNLFVSDRAYLDRSEFTKKQKNYATGKINTPPRNNCISSNTKSKGCDIIFLGC